MSLLHPTTGELCDRIVVLSLKIRHGRDAGKDVSHFVQERLEINMALRGHFVDSMVLNELTSIHAAIWPLIETSPPELLRLNARRIAIREEIDKLTGEYRGPEKV